MTLSNSDETAPGVPRYTPGRSSKIGAALNPATAPTLFKPLSMRSVELHNRVAVSPMCMYSATDGHLSDYQVAHLGRLAMQGAGLVFVEATGVAPEGRITPQCSGIWADSHVAPLRRVTEMLHSQGAKAAIQLAHAGRKASDTAPWLGHKTAGEEAGGWPRDVLAPSAIAFDADSPLPREMTLADIRRVVVQFAEAAERAVKAGFDVIEIHGAHGYLINEFLSPRTNTRTDEYGGSFENRTRLVREVTEAVRAVIPADMPLWLRISVTDGMEAVGGPMWGLEQSIELARLLPSWGIDLIDVSSGLNISEQPRPADKSGQRAMAKELRRALRAEGNGLLVGVVGDIRDAQLARALVQEGEDESADVVLVGRQFLVEPSWTLRVAEELDVPVSLPIMSRLHKLSHSQKSVL
ncbi:putative NADPH dehydrogenase [Escovopsis weberi]|uniref:Putative NADPH dehydrogenase n=1 Tax=Escovopsis weberi TaxID=150374 RepID=A0A0M8N6C2_ESCWE|nr:putative NADPH dehydrogenase [Escovopsis weberi]